MSGFDRKAAEALGWQFRVGESDGVDDGLAIAEKGGAQLSVKGGPALFELLRRIADREGQEFPDGQDPKVVLAVSGESWVPPDPDPVVPSPSVVAADAIDAAVAKGDLKGALQALSTVAQLLRGGS